MAMPIAFPSSPTLNQIYTFGNFTWKWNGSAWDAVNSSLNTKVSATNVSLGSQSGVQVNYTYYTVANVCARGFISWLKVTSNNTTIFDVEVRGAASSSGTLFFQAMDIQRTSYEIKVPFYYENDVGTQQLYVGIRNRGGGTFTFTLANLRAEKFG